MADRMKRIDEVCADVATRAGLALATLVLWGYATTAFFDGDPYPWWLPATPAALVVGAWVVRSANVGVALYRDRRPRRAHGG